ncbi:MAG: DUF1846 domain-containing protein [Clostridiales bacterium]|nr:DUF1846 domain-containing protein [Clostridiales bacterium]
MRIGFDNDLYIRRQTKEIMKRIEQFDGKLYLEFGGKLFDDWHAARVLPGFDVNAKVKLLQSFSDQAEIIFCINASDIEKSKVRADYGITYDMDLLRTIDNMRALGLYINSVVITKFSGQPSAHKFRQMLEMRDVKTYAHYPIIGYPTNVDLIVSESGYGVNDYIETTRPLVVVTAPGPCSGKLATCLSQLYHESKRNIKAGYAKFETFPIWNLPLKHPVNLAYEAATADLNDVNIIDPFHLDAYGVTTVNYNRDVEVFPVLREIINRIMGKEIYRSPTDMGVNMAGYGIIDDEVVREAAKQEIIRRYYRYWCDYRQGRYDSEPAHKVEMLMKQLGIKPEDREVVTPALNKSKKSGVTAMALQLTDGRITTGKGSELMNSASGCLINAIKLLAGLSDEIHLMSLAVLEPILKLKRDVLNYDQSALNLEEVLIALSICAVTNPAVEAAVSQLPKLAGCDAHSTCILSPSDEKLLAKLGINITCEAVYPTKNLYYV